MIETICTNRRGMMLRVETSFQDSPGDDFYFVLYYKDRLLNEQIEELCLKDGDTVILWEEDCGDFEMEATLLFDYKHPMMSERALWARADNKTLRRRSQSI